MSQLQSKRGAVKGAVPEMRAMLEASVAEHRLWRSQKVLSVSG